MKKLKKFFTFVFDDFRWKLLALVAAGVLWFVGMHMNDPTQNESVWLRLRLANIEIMGREGIVVLNEDALREINVSVLVRGVRSDMVYLMAAEADRIADFVDVSVDFRAINAEAVASAEGVTTQVLYISPNLHPDFEHVSISPSRVMVEVDMILERNFSVQVVQTGDVPPGFELRHIWPHNQTVRIRGARTDILAISRVEAEVDITGVHGDVEQTVQFVVFDYNGYDMTDCVTLNFVETTAAIRVWQTRPAEIILRGTGTPAPNFDVAGISGDVETVTVVGSVEDLEEFEAIFVEIDLQGASANITQEIQISDWLPEGVYLRQEEAQTITATARIETIEERAITVPYGNLRTRGVVVLFTLVDEATPIDLTVRGPRSLIDALDAADILPEFDLRGLPIGVHTVELLVDLPDGISLVGTPPTLLVQIHEPAAPENNDNEELPPEDDEPEENGEEEEPVEEEDDDEEDEE